VYGINPTGKTHIIVVALEMMQSVWYGHWLDQVEEWMILYQETTIEEELFASRVHVLLWFWSGMVESFCAILRKDKVRRNRNDVMSVFDLYYGSAMRRCYCRVSVFMYFLIVQLSN